jgi:hypothetical protein
MPTSTRVLLILALLVAGALLAPAAEAQTQVNPVIGEYGDSYLVAGRVVDGAGRPVAGGTLLVEVEQRGAQAKPFRAAISCFGDFIFTLEIKALDTTGRVHLTLDGAPGGVANVTHTVSFDPFFRRSDVTMVAPGTWGLECPDQAQHWPGRVTVAGRVVNRTEPYEVDGTELHARPYVGYVRVRYYDETGALHCPPSQRGGTACDFIPTDTRGDFRYSFVFPGEKAALGRMEVAIGNDTYEATVDPTHRIAVLYIEATGQGAPEPKRTPPAPLGLVLGAIAAVALVRNVLVRDRR